MALELELPPELELRLRQEAERSGEGKEVIALRVLGRHLPPLLDERSATALALLEQWVKRAVEHKPTEAEQPVARDTDAPRTSNRLRFPPELEGITW